MVRMALGMNLLFWVFVLLQKCWNFCYYVACSCLYIEFWVDQLTSSGSLFSTDCWSLMVYSFLYLILSLSTCTIAFAVKKCFSIFVLKLKYTNLYYWIACVWLHVEFKCTTYMHYVMKFANIWLSERKGSYGCIF